ncbi:MAG: glycine cleavage system protein GcvH [Phycisphaerae bacterium]|nr:glycine cleavage system protein GcvH [Phycisphaerae bacterium]
MSIPSDRKYSETHEWYMADGNTVTMGITQHAADQLTDITFVDLPKVGLQFQPGDVVGEVESVKATSELFTAVGGKVLAINENLTDHPELINDNAFEDGWLVKFEVGSLAALEQLMDSKEYKSYARG